VQSWFSFYNDDPEDIRNRLENGGGAMLDIGCYQVNLSRMLFGAEPEAITGAVRRDPEMGIDIVTSAILQFPGGGHSAFTCSIRSDADQRVHLIGSTGRIDFEIPFNVPGDRRVHLSVTRGAEPPAPTTTETHDFGPASHYQIQVERFARAIIDDTPVAVPPTDAVANLRVIEAILAS